MARAFTARENAPAAPPLKARTRRDGARAGWPRLEPPVIGTGPRELAGHGPLGDVEGDGRREDHGVSGHASCGGESERPTARLAAMAYASKYFWIDELVEW